MEVQKHPSRSITDLLRNSQDSRPSEHEERRSRTDVIPLPKNTTCEPTPAFLIGLPVFSSSNELDLAKDDVEIERVWIFSECFHTDQRIAYGRCGLFWGNDAHLQNCGIEFSRTKTPVPGKSFVATPDSIELWAILLAVERFMHSDDSARVLCIYTSLRDVHSIVTLGWKQDGGSRVNDYGHANILRAIQKQIKSGPEKQIRMEWLGSLTRNQRCVSFTEREKARYLCKKEAHPL